MKFVCYSEWSQLPDSANVLFAQSEKDSLFFSRQWFENVTTTLDDDQTLLLACVVSNEQDGIAANAVTETSVLAILPLINSDGHTLCSLKHRYTTHYSLLLANVQEHTIQQVLTCLVQGLSQLPCEALLLEPVAAEDSTIVDLQKIMCANGFSCEQLFRHYNWIYRLQGLSYADYIAARPARLRNTIARKQRKLAREHGYDIRLYAGKDVPAAMADYYAVYTASWKANEQFTEFFDGVVQSCSEPDMSGQGWSRLAVLYVNAKPVAAQLWFVLHNKANIFRLAYDEKWKAYSPGSILTRFLMEYVIDTDNVTEIDFLTGNDAYKQDWMSERRDRVALSCVKNDRPASWYAPFIALMKGILNRR